MLYTLEANKLFTSKHINLYINTFNPLTLEIVLLSNTLTLEIVLLSNNHETSHKANINQIFYCFNYQSGIKYFSVKFFIILIQNTIKMF